MSDQSGPIALIEDKDTVKEGLKTTLTEEGFNVVSVKKSADLLKRLVDVKPSIIISDLDADNPKDPYAVIAAIKKEAALKEAEMFVYTCAIDVKTEIELRRLKVVSYFTKCTDPKHLIKGIRNHFSWDEMSQEYDPWEVETPSPDEPLEALMMAEENHLKEETDPIVAIETATPARREDSGEFRDMIKEVRPGIGKRLQKAEEEPAPPPPDTGSAAAVETPRPQEPEDSGEFQDMLQDFQAGMDKHLQKVEETPEPPPPDTGSAAAVDGARQENYEDSGEFQDMLQEFQTGIDKHLKDSEEEPEAHYNLGLSYYEMGLNEQALDQLKRCVCDPDWKERSLTMIGAVYRKMGEYEEALKSFKTCYQCAPDNFARLGYRYEIADTLVAQGKLKEAYKMFATVYRADKEFKDTRDRLLELKSSLGSGKSA